MVKILLIANEAIICKQFITNIDWGSTPLYFAGCVSSVQEFLEWKNADEIDILVVESPQLFSQIPEGNLGKKVLILSEPQNGFASNVRFTQADDQINLNLVLEEMVGECLKDNLVSFKETNYAQFVSESKMHVREKLLRDLLYGNPIDSLADRYPILQMSPDAQYYVVGIEIDNVEEHFRTLEEQEKKEIVEQLRHAISLVLKEQGELALLTVSEGSFVLLVPAKEVKNISLTCHRIHKNFYKQTSISSTYGIGGRAVPMARLQDGYVRAYEALLYKYLVGNNKVISHDEIPSYSLNGNQLFDSASIQEQLVRAVKSGEKDVIEELCSKWFLALGKSTPTLVKSQLLQLISNLTVGLLDSGVSLTDLFGEEDVLVKKVLKFDTIFDVELWVKQILQYICEYMNDKKQRASYRVAIKAAQYIDQHYVENVSVEMVAAAVSLSAGYLMGVFKKEFNTSIIGYITDKRIEKAKELLTENKLKIQEIAEMVGYSNATFFSSTFHKRVGQTPRQYREQYTEENKK